jgi:hypothetical protein
MRNYTVKVFEDDCGTFTFTGIPASNKNEACRKGLETFMIFLEETEIKGVSATATLERV